MVEGMAGTWLFTDNTNFAGGRTREQDAIVILQGHLTYRFTRVMWLAADGNYFRGGTTTIGGKQNIDFQNNSRIGATFSKSLAPRPCDPCVAQPRRLHDHRRALHVARRRLQLCVAALTADGRSDATAAEL